LAAIVFGWQIKNVWAGVQSNMTKPKGGGSSRPRPQGAKVDIIIQDEIGAKLRQLYSTMVEEPVPDRFRELLRRLEEGKKRDV
jgi:hypothetical protein